MGVTGLLPVVFLPLLGVAMYAICNSIHLVFGYSISY